MEGRRGRGERALPRAPGHRPSEEEDRGPPPRRPSAMLTSAETASPSPRRRTNTAAAYSGAASPRSGRAWNSATRSERNPPCDDERRHADREAAEERARQPASGENDARTPGRGRRRSWLRTLKFSDPATAPREIELAGERASETRENGAGEREHAKDPAGSVLREAAAWASRRTNEKGRHCTATRRNPIAAAPAAHPSLPARRDRGRGRGAFPDHEREDPDDRDASVSDAPAVASAAVRTAMADAAGVILLVRRSSAPRARAGGRTLPSADGGPDDGEPGGEEDETRHCGGENAGAHGPRQPECARRADDEFQEDRGRPSAQAREQTRPREGRQQRGHRVGPERGSCVGVRIRPGIRPEAKATAGMRVPRHELEHGIRQGGGWRPRASLPAAPSMHPCRSRGRAAEDAPRQKTEARIEERRADEGQQRDRMADRRALRRRNSDPILVICRETIPRRDSSNFSQWTSAGASRPAFGDPWRWTENPAGWTKSSRRQVPIRANSLPTIHLRNEAKMAIELL